MTYNGYFKLGGTELVNSVRVLDYARKLAPAFGLVSRQPCEGLARTLGRSTSEDVRGPLAESRTNYHRNPRAASPTFIGFAEYLTAGGTGVTIYSAEPTSSVPVRTNLATNPNPTSAGGTAAWNFQNGTGETTTLSYVTSALDGPAPGVNNYMRRTVTTAKSTGVSGFFYREPAGAAIAGASGAVRHLAMWVRFSQAITSTASGNLRSGATNVGTGSMSGAIPANTWTLLSAPVTATGAFDGAQIFASTMSVLPAGATYDVALAHVEDTATWDGAPFWGSQEPASATGGVLLTHSYAGLPMNSASQRRVGFAPGVKLGEDSPTFGRFVVQTPSTTAAGWDAGRANTRPLATGVTGDVVTAVVRHRWSGPGGPRGFRLKLQLRRPAPSSAIITASVAQSAPVVSVSGDIVEHTVSVTATETFGAADLILVQDSGAALPSGAVHDVGAIRAHVNTDAPYPYFDGLMADTVDVDYSFTGTANNSPSVKSTYTIVQVDNSYVSPEVDNAPWYDPARTASGDFLGMYPLEVAGIDDSTRAVTMSDLVGDGAIAGRTRRAAREMRFETLLLSRSEEGLDAGLSWLESTLDSFRCDGSASDCEPGSLEFYSSCPDLTTSPVVDRVALWDGTVPADEAINWTGGGGASFTSIGTLDFSASGPGGTISRPLEGLVSGQWYRLEFISSGDGRLSLTVGDQTERLPRTAVEMGSTVRPFYMEFLARKSTETLDITFTAPASYASTPIVLGSYRIDRTRGNSIKAQFVVEANSGEQRGKEPYGLSHLSGHANSGMNAYSSWALPMTPNTWERYQGNISSRMYMQSKRSSGTGSWLNAARGRVVSLSIPRLPPGSYRTSVWLWADTTIAAIPSPTYYVEMLSGGSNGIAYSANVAVPRTDSGLAATQIDVTFDITAVEADRTISVVIGMVNASGSSASITSTDQITVVPLAYTVIETSTAMASIPAPDTSLKYRRRMNRVSAIDGPRVLERYRHSCGWAARVSFGLVAGDPRKYKVGRFIGTYGIINGPSAQTARCRNGEPYLYNLATNPTLQTGTTGWDVGSGLAWTASTASSTPDMGAGALTGTVSTNTGQIYGRHTYSITTSGWYHVFGLLRRSSGINAWAFSVGTDASNPANIVPETQMTKLTTEASEQFFGDFYVDVVGEGIVSRSITVTVRQTTAVSSNTTFWIDGLVLGEGRYRQLTGYFDGTNAQASKEPVMLARAQGWDGTPHASTSWFIPEAPPRLPCVSFPRAPRAPIVRDDCVLVGQRTGADFEIQVSPGAVSTYGKVVPRLTLNVIDDTTSAAIRIKTLTYVRMRWYRNPLGLPVAELDPCAFEFEQTITMVPYDGITVVDGETRTARSTSFPTSPLVYDLDMTARVFGPDFQGTSWPELSCGEQYTVLVSTSSPTVGGKTTGLIPSGQLSLGVELVSIS